MIADDAAIDAVVVAIPVFAAESPFSAFLLGDVVLLGRETDRKSGVSVITESLSA
jgi:hypothetical protein